MKKILIPIDASYDSVKSIITAAEIAKKNKAEICIVNSYELPKIFGETNSFSTPYPVLRLKHSIEKNIIDSLKTKTKKLLSKAGIGSWNWKDDIIIKNGTPKEVIISELKKDDVGLVVMETRNHIEAKDSITYDVLKNSNTPVLAVPTMSSKCNKIKSIVYSTDLNHSNNEALGKLANLAKIYDADITLLHVGERGDSAISTKRKKHKLNKLLLRIPLKNERKNFKLIYADTALDGLNRFVKVMNPGLFAMTTHTQSFFQTFFHESLTKLILAKSNIPVLTFNKDNISEYNNQLHRTISPIQASLF